MQEKQSLFILTQKTQVRLKRLLIYRGIQKEANTVMLNLAIA